MPCYQILNVHLTVKTKLSNIKIPLKIKATKNKTQITISPWGIAEL
jgi:hypothetical protein